MRVLVIGAHADDAEVSMGGTLAQLVTQGHDVKLLTLIIPCEDQKGGASDARKQIRRKNCEEAAVMLGVSLEIADLSPYTLCFGRDLVKLIDAKIREFRPNVIFTHWDHDSHQDHRAVARSTFAAARYNNTSLLLFEQLTLGGITPDTFRGNVFVDISETLNQKLESIRAYDVLSKSSDPIEAVTSLARFRGNQIGVKYAECFEVCKVIATIDDHGMLFDGLWKPA